MVNKEDHKIPVGEIVGGKWKILTKLGEGGFGAVYKVSNTRIPSKDEFAMKVESVKAEEPMLKMEAAVLKIFRNSKLPQIHTCQYVESGGTGTIWFVVMQLVGQSVADLRRACPNGRFSESTASRLDLQALESVEALHRIGFVHRDIKPANFAMGKAGEQARIVFLLDFGLARQYMDQDGNIRKARSVAGFRGTIRYASINTHLRKDLGRHDDLWSLLYMTVEFHRGELPWRKDKDKNDVLKRKKETTADQLMSGMEKEYREWYNTLSTLKFESVPNYSEYYMHLKAIISRKHYRDTDPFDWEEGGCGYESVAKSGIAADPYDKKQKADQKRLKEKIENEEQPTQ